MRQNAKTGFTLIELAVVIAIIAILAAIAIPRLVNATASSECSSIKYMANQLSSAAAIWATENSAMPTSFDQFVSAGPVPNPAPLGAPTISLQSFGPNAASSPCTLGGNTISCNGTFSAYNPRYTLSAGSVTLNKPVPAVQADAPACQ